MEAQMFNLRRPQRRIKWALAVDLYTVQRLEVNQDGAALRAPLPEQSARRAEVLDRVRAEGSTDEAA